MTQIQYGTTQKGVKLSFELKGMDELEKVLRDIPEQAKKAARKEMQAVCKDLKEKSQAIVPVDTGELKASAFYRTEFDELHDGVVGAVGYGMISKSGGSQSPDKYALRQHEEIKWHHPNGGSAKFLETPYKENIERYLGNIGDAIKRAIEKG